MIKVVIKVIVLKKSMELNRKKIITKKNIDQINFKKLKIIGVKENHLMTGVVQITFIVMKVIHETMESVRMTITMTVLEALQEIIEEIKNIKNHIIIITVDISTWVLVKENDIESNCIHN